MERLSKVMSNYGYCSRRKAEQLIANGKVKVNGKVVKELWTRVEESDLIEVEGRPLEKPEKIYIMLNKPRGVITSTKDDKNRKTVIDLIPIEKRIYPVGRLDYNTTGLLLLTNDGELANLIMHPKNKIEKVYIAKIKGILAKESIKKLEKGIVIEGVKTSRAKVKVRNVNKKKNNSIVELTIYEGRNHQVKKMFKAVGHEVLKLKRERISFLELGNLKSGEFRFLTPKEVKKIYNEVKK